MVRALFLLLAAVSIATYSAEHSHPHPHHGHETEKTTEKKTDVMPIADDFGVAEVCPACSDTCKTATSWDECFYCILDARENNNCAAKKEKTAEHDHHH